MSLPLFRSHGMVVVLGVIVFSTAAEAQPDFRGYLENRLYATFIDNKFAPGDYRKNLRWGDYNRFRVEMSDEVSQRSYINLSVDYFIYKGYILQQLRNPGSETDPSVEIDEQRLSVDRIYLKLYFSRGDVTIGKQRISWGQSLVWSPFDVFNRVNFLEPAEEKSGVNAFAVSVPLGSTGSFEGVFAPESTSDESRAGVRIIWNMFGSEFSGNVIHNVINDFSQRITGLSVKADALLGIWFEGAYVDENALPGRVFPSRSYFRWLAGADYSYEFGGRQFYFLSEFSRNESGEPHKQRYDYMKARSEGRTLLARDYLYGSVQFRYSDFSRFNAAVLVNVNDGGAVFMPSVVHSLFPDTELTLGVFLALADAGTEINPSRVNDPFNFAGNSVVYCWFKLFM